jgi:2-keto-4-pentenoate hydratase/2-oxohepta-3-ene-1,7-dioic acid hydratase in catechol pathway
MRLVTFERDHTPAAGVVREDGSVVALADIVRGAPAAMLEVIRAWPDIGRRVADADLRSAKGTPLERVRLLAPIPRPARNVLCVGWNYADHFAEGKAFRGASAPQEIPPHPALFTKSAASVVGPDMPVLHPGPHSDEMDFEAELAVIVGTRGRDIVEARALDHVFGYTVANDVSVRDVQRSKHGGQWFKGKSFDTHCPLGPWIVTADDIPDPQVLPISSRINGVTKQSSNTKYMVFGVARIVSELSQGMTLEPGDVILTGTPSGVGFARTPPEYLRPGDVMEMEIEGIGVLRNPVVEYS